MKKTKFEVTKMDCPSEERMVRMALESESDIKRLDFNLRAHEVTVIHETTAEHILSLLDPLGYGAKISDSGDLNETDENSSALPKSSVVSESKVLKQLMAINGFMFLSEFVVGWFADSTGLIADSLDMLADAFVYGLSLYAVGKAIKQKKLAARLSGYFQLFLAAGLLIEVVRRFFGGSEPMAPFMIAVSLIALTANVACLVLLAKHREGEVHMQASWIFSTNDVLANLGVVLAGVLIYFTGSPLPDLIIGAAISAIVFRGALSILRISKKSA